MLITFRFDVSDKLVSVVEKISLPLGEIMHNIEEVRDIVENLVTSVDEMVDRVNDDFDFIKGELDTANTSITDLKAQVEANMTAGAERDAALASLAELEGSVSNIGDRVLAADAAVDAVDPIPDHPPVEPPA